MADHGQACVPLGLVVGDVGLAFEPGGLVVIEANNTVPYSINQLKWQAYLEAMHPILQHWPVE